MIAPLLSALAGRCPSCQKGPIYKTFLRAHELCPVCGVRFERWNGSWTIPVVMGYGSGAVFAFLLGFVLLKADRLEGAENIIIPATLAFTALFYPLCKNLSYGLLYNNGFIFPDPPKLVRAENEMGRPLAPIVREEPLALSPPEIPDLDDPDDDAPTTMEDARPKRRR